MAGGGGGGRSGGGSRGSRVRQIRANRTQVQREDATFRGRSSRLASARRGQISGVSVSGSN